MLKSVKEYLIVDSIDDNKFSYGFIVSDKFLTFGIYDSLLN